MKIYFILNSFQFFVVDNGYTTADDSTEARVRIKKLTYDQVGGYTCRAQNKLGSAEKKFDVQLGSQTDCNIGLCESYSSAGSAGLNTNGIVFGISLIGSVILFMTVKWTLFTTHSEKKSFQKIRQRGIHIIASNIMSSTTTISILGTISFKNIFWISVSGGITYSKWKYVCVLEKRLRTFDKICIPIQTPNSLLKFRVNFLKKIPIIHLWKKVICIEL